MADYHCPIVILGPNCFRFRVESENPPSPPLVKLKPLSKLPNVETPGAFDRNIRFSVPTHQRSTFDRAIAGLPPAFLGFPTTGEGFDDPAACKARLQGFSRMLSSSSCEEDPWLGRCSRIDSCRDCTEGSGRKEKR